ncbi:radical SAM protein [Varunaivibrio sulfuroxidans]|uniref:Radical SAM protein with 4Fe4S-binding SPASM domain n=1 Tax=Varunaivibrio sulfuroxidans TaxID=1773489 RepID=A0A4R3J6T5_9PROT|nr:radical SAM protein [Varunaivibrio sulfuroxidans]TCS60566.1 radical SAM protein with 4Fe4S-binding SPASM domain [Varunaivibrio sulfuroxidans]WES30056.1 radical SAM protein [Varunaivibrio sulfuroxidans]
MSITAKWDITSRCNLNCKHCCVGGAHYKSTTPELSDDGIEKIIDDLRRNDVTHVQFVGGEPLLRNNFSDILALSRKAFDTVTLNTNGLFLTPRWFAENRAHLPDVIIISLDGPDRESHEFIRGKNTYRPLIDNIRRLTALVRKSDAPVRITLNAILSHAVLTRARDFVDLAKSLGVDAFGITNIIAVDSALENLDRIGAVTWEEKYAFLIDLVGHAKAHDLPVSFEATPMGYAYINAVCATKYPTAFHCGAGSHGIYIQADGAVYPCMRCKFEMGAAAQTTGSAPLGENSLDGFLTSGFRGDFIAAKDGGRADDTLCTTCKFGPYCTPCMFEADDDGHVPECLYIHEAVKQLGGET